MTRSHSDPETMRTLLSAFERNRATSGEILDDIVRSTFLYALRLSATPRVRTRHGKTLDIFGELDAFRRDVFRYMTDTSDDGWAFTEDVAANGVGTRFWRGTWHRRTLLESYPAMARTLGLALDGLCQRHPDLDKHALDQALSRKSLALALGGGGGTGFVHQALFQLLETHHITPVIMTGTSMGALMGFFRAIQKDYDAALSVLHMPSWLTLVRHVAPCMGQTRHGLPSFCRFHFSRLLDAVMPHFGWTEIPHFSELRIPFASVTSGIQRDNKVVETIASGRSGLFSSLFQMTHLTWKAACGHAAQIAHALTAADSVRELTLGFDPLTADLVASDGIAFSALVPGVINYEIPSDHVQSRRIMDTVFERDRLYRCVDGGLTSNVPVRPLRREIDTLRLGHTNVHVVGLDVFAPQIKDGFFYPLEQMANTNADLDAHAADAFVRLEHLLSPMNLSPTMNQFRWLNQHFAQEFQTELDVIRYVTKPLRPLAALPFPSDVQTH